MSVHPWREGQARHLSCSKGTVDVYDRVVVLILLLLLLLFISFLGCVIYF